MLNFPGIVEPVSTGQAANDYLTRTVTPTLLKGLTELCKMKPADPIVSVKLFFFLSQFNLFLQVFASILQQLFFDVEYYSQLLINKQPHQAKTHHIECI